MKNLIVFISLLLAFSFGNAQEIKWYSWDEGYKLAKEQNKPMLVFVYAPWCNMSKRMLEKTFTSKDVASNAQAGFIAIKFDIDKATKEEDSVRRMDLKQFTGTDELKKIIGGPQLAIPKTVLFNLLSQKQNSLEGVLDPEELTTSLKEFVKI